MTHAYGIKSPNYMETMERIIVNAAIQQLSSNAESRNTPEL